MERRAQPAHRWALGVVCLLAGLCLATYAEHAVALLSFPYEIDPGEGFDVAGAVTLLSGGQPYADSTRFPFFALHYPPVYSLVVAPLVAALGPSMLGGRLVSLAAGVGVALVIAGAVHLGRAPLGPAVLAGLAWLASAYVLHVTPLARTTSLMLFLGIAGLYCLERAAERRPGPGPWLPLGVGLLLAGVYTKPVGLDAAAAGAAYLLTRWRLAAGPWLGRERAPPPAVPPARGGSGGHWLAAAGWLAGLGLGLHLLLESVSSGHYWPAVFLANAYPWDAGQALAYTSNFLITHGLLLLLGVGGLVAHGLGRWPSVWVFYLAAGMVTAATSGRWGAGESYFLPLVAASCVLGGRLLAWLPAESAWRLLALALLGGHMLLASAGPWPLQRWVPAWDRGFQAHALRAEPTAADLARGREVQGFVEAADGPVLTEAAGFVLLAGRQPAGNPMLIRGLSEHGRYDPSPLVQALEQQTFRGVILLGQWYPPAVLQAIGANYDVVRRVQVAGSTYLLMSPRGR